VSGSPAVKPVSSDENHLKTVLNGDFGRLLCIGFIDKSPRGEIDRVVSGWDAQHGAFHVDERIILTEFWLCVKTFRLNVDRIVGHSIYDFDLKFILKRSIIHGMRPVVALSFAGYCNQPIFDTMYGWERWIYGSKADLERLPERSASSHRSRMASDAR
jgi:hypothetical protein